MRAADLPSIKEMISTWKERMLHSDERMSTSSPVAPGSRGTQKSEESGEEESGEESSSGEEQEDEAVTLDQLARQGAAIQDVVGQLKTNPPAPGTAGADPNGPTDADASPMSDAVQPAAAAVQPAAATVQPAAASKEPAVQPAAAEDKATAAVQPAAGAGTPTTTSLPTAWCSRR